MSSARIAVFVTATSLVACSLLTDTDGLSGGGGSSSSSSSSGGGPDAGGDGETPPAPPLACPNAGRSCVTEAPTGWNGPLIVYDGDEAAAPACPPEMNVARVDAYRGFHEPAAHTCTGCSCGPGQGVMCSPVLKKWDTTCANATDSQKLSPGFCVKVAGDTGYSVDFEASGGSCNPVGGVPSLPPIPWDSKTRACGAPELLRTGCPSGQICAPDPPYPFRAKHCISRGGDVDCPGAPYTEKLVATDVDDQRGCTKCTCGPPTSECRGTGAQTSSPNCAGIPQFKQFPASCDSDADDRYLMVSTAGPISSKCELTAPAAPTGAVAPGGPTTICCTP